MYNSFVLFKPCCTEKLSYLFFCEYFFEKYEIVLDSMDLFYQQTIISSLDIEFLLNTIRGIISCFLLSIR